MARAHSVPGGTPSSSVCRPSRFSGVRVICSDKTGTLTQGRPPLTDLTPAKGFDKGEALSLAASLEARSEHPIARAVVTAADLDGDLAAALGGAEAPASPGGGPPPRLDLLDPGAEDPEGDAVLLLTGDAAGVAADAAVVVDQLAPEHAVSVPTLPSPTLGASTPPSPTLGASNGAGS